MNRLLLHLAAVVAVLAAACEPNRPVYDDGNCRVERVTDGDTIRVSCLDAPVRLLLVDAPEVARGGRPGECFGDESREFLRRLLSRGSTVELEAGVRDTDPFGRYLRYVHAGGELVNERLVREGYAVRYRAAEDTRHRDRIAAAEDEARAAGRGLWAACR